MTRQAIIDRTIEAINHLPEDKAQEISDFADFLHQRYEESVLTRGIQKLATDGKAFEFLRNEEELYSVSDLKEIYNG